MKDKVPACEHKFRWLNTKICPVPEQFRTHKAIPKYSIRLSLNCAECGKFLGNPKQTEELISYLNDKLAPIPAPHTTPPLCQNCP